MKKLCLLLCLSFVFCCAFWMIHRIIVHTIGVPEYVLDSIITALTIGSVSALISCKIVDNKNNDNN